MEVIILFFLKKEYMSKDAFPFMEKVLMPDINFSFSKIVTRGFDDLFFLKYLLKFFILNSLLYDQVYYIFR